MESILDKNNIDMVLYHGSCLDGYGSAFVVWYYYKKKFGLDNANALTYLPCYYLKEGQQLTNDSLEKMSGKNILMCDFSYKYDELVKIINVAKSFMILDHHKSAEENLKNIPPHLKIFSMKKSGVGITWDFMFPEKPLPKFLAHIQDYDIWTYQIPGTREFVTFFNEQKLDFNLWEEYLDETKIETAIQTGKNWLEYQNIIVSNIVKRTSYIIQEINNQYCIVLYCNSPEFKSYVGNKMFDKVLIGDFSCVWDYNLYQNQTNYSLRSTNDRMDVSAIAQKFGGGGHRNAAGVSFSGIVERLPLPVVENNGLLDLLMNNKKGTIRMRGESLTYTLFIVTEINNKWFEDKYLDLVKRKCNDSILIVFEKPSDSVKVDTQNSTVLPQKDYLIHYNEKCVLIDPAKTLQFIAMVTNHSVLEFTSEKEFEELFVDFEAQEMDESGDDEEEGESDWTL